MKNLYFVIIAMAICLGGIAYHQGKTQQSLDKRIAALEATQYMAQPDMAWVAEAMESIFTLGFNDYNLKINKKNLKYFTKSGLKSYEELLNQLGVISHLSTTQSVLLGRISGLPKIISSSIYETVQRDGTSYDAKYIVTMNLGYQSGAKTEFMGILQFEVTVGSKYIEEGTQYIIKNINLLSNPKETAKAKH